MVLYPEPEEASALSGLRLLGQEGEDASGSVLISCAGIEARFKLPSPLQGQNGEGSMVYYNGKWVSPNHFEEACGRKGKVWRRSFYVHTGSPQDKEGWVRMDEWLQRVNQGLGLNGAEAQTRSGKQGSEPGGVSRESADSETESPPLLKGRWRHSSVSQNGPEPARAAQAGQAAGTGAVSHNSQQPTDKAKPHEPARSPPSLTPKAAPQTAADAATGTPDAAALLRRERQLRYSRFLEGKVTLGTSNPHPKPPPPMGPHPSQSGVQANGSSSAQMPPPPSPKVNKPTTQPQPPTARNAGKCQPAAAQRTSAESQPEDKLRGAAGAKARAGASAKKQAEGGKASKGATPPKQGAGEKQRTTRSGQQQAPSSQQQADGNAIPSSSSNGGVKRGKNSDITPEAKRQRIEQNLREAREAEEHAAKAAAAAAERRARMQQQEEQWKQAMKQLEQERQKHEAAKQMVEELERQKQEELEELKQKQAQELQEPRRAFQERQAAVEEAERAVAKAEEDFWKCC